MKPPKTIIIDIDGCILEHKGNITNTTNSEPTILPGVKEQFEKWNMESAAIIIMTGRRESMREFTENQLKEVGLFWDQLIMGAGRGERILINDMKPDGMKSAKAVNLERNKGPAQYGEI